MAFEIEKKLEEIRVLAKTQQNKLTPSDYHKYYAEFSENDNLTVLESFIDQESIVILSSNIEVDFDENEAVPFNPKDLDTVSAKITIDSMHKRIKNNEIDLKPPFQRRAGLWDAIRQSRLIESILLRITLPAFYFDATDDECWIVIDGLQRLTAIKKFVVEKSLKLEGLEFFKELEGKNFDEIGRPNQRCIEETEINICKLLPPTPTNAKYIIFKRLNTGGISLEPQEIRNALFQGQAVNLLDEMSEVEVFKNIVSKRVSTTRMEDKDFCLRYVAYVCFSRKVISETETFLNDTMKRIGEMSKSELEKIKLNFESDLKRANKLFGEFPFKKPIKNARLSKLLFQSWLYVLHNLSEIEFENVIKNKEQFLESYIGFCQNERNEIFNSKDRAIINERNNKFRILIQNAIDGGNLDD